MGLMTETPWESAMSGVASSSTDFHRENLRHIKQMQMRARQRKESNEPLKAFPPSYALTEANKKKFDHVQSRVSDWARSGSQLDDGKSCSIKSGGGYLKGHEKTGPFFEDNDAAIRVQRLSGLRSKSRTREETKERYRRQASDYGTMSQSCQSIPPLNLEDEEEMEDDLGRDDVSIPFELMSGQTRFSDVTLEERKDRIANLVAEIYNTVPLSQGNPTRKSLQQTLKRFASVDQVSNVDSVISGAARPPRWSQPKMMGSNVSQVASTIKRFASSPKLSGHYPANSRQHQQKISVQNFGPLSTSTSMMNLNRAMATNEHKPVRKNKSVPTNAIIRPVAATDKKMTSPSPMLQPSVSKSPIGMKQQLRKSTSPSPVASREDPDLAQEEDLGEPDQEGEEFVMKGTDVDYVRANVESATAVGHHRRKESQSVLQEKEKAKKTSLQAPETYHAGTVPKYLQERQAEWKEEAQRIEKARPDPDCPAGHVLLTDDKRQTALAEMKVQYEATLREMNSFPVRTDTLRVRQKKAELETKLDKLELAMRTYERPKVFVKMQ